MWAHHKGAHRETGMKLKAREGQSLSKAMPAFAYYSTATLSSPSPSSRIPIPIPITASLSSIANHHHRRRHIAIALLATSAALALHPTPPLALAQNWGTHSFLKERYFEPGLSPEDAVARIKQTAEGLHSIRDMLETMSWRYVIFYIRLKSAYLSQDLKTALSTLPQARKQDYVNTANELIDNMAELDYYVRTPKVYESYLYYEKTLKSIDDLVALLA